MKAVRDALVLLVLVLLALSVRVSARPADPAAVSNPAAAQVSSGSEVQPAVDRPIRHDPARGNT